LRQPIDFEHQARLKGADDDHVQSVIIRLRPNKNAGHLMRHFSSKQTHGECPVGQAFFIDAQAVSFLTINTRPLATGSRQT